ncbi:MAG: SGNH hydrolase domain-containing protein, partial [Cyanobacteriota bacterium]|nr:SGNH hydrolase domain-containing protein [Cyanobacteriota bacterium]
LALGLLSYSLYLWHWPVFVFFRLTLGLNTPLLRLLASLLALGLAVAAWALVERPLRRHKASSAVVFATAAVGLSAAWGAVDALAFPIGRVFLGNREVRVPRSERYETDAVLDPSGPMTPRRCRGINNDDASRAERCHRPAAAGHSTLMLLGDSHALQYAPMVSAVARQGDLGFRLAWKPGCLVLPGLQAIPDIPGYKPCTPFVQNELAAAERQLLPGDVLVLSSFLQLYLFPMDQTVFEEAIHPRLMAAGRHLTAAAGRQRFQEEVRGLIRRFGDRGVRVVLIQDLPVLTGRTFTCEGAQALPFASLISSGCVPPPAVTATQRRQMRDLLAATVAGTDAVVFDPADPFLDASGRLRYRDDQGRYTFVDDDHITISASRDLAPRFAAFLRQHGLATTAAPHGG